MVERLSLHSCKSLRYDRTDRRDFTPMRSNGMLFAHHHVDRLRENSLLSSLRSYADAIVLLILCVWVVASRVPLLNDFDYLGKDGPLYIKSLALDAQTYDVPPPGNLGYVLLGKAASLVISSPVRAYLAVNIGLTAVGVGFCYLFATLIVSRPLATALTFALSCNTIVWYHGLIIASYPVWLVALPAIGWFGVRYRRHSRTADLVGVSVSLAIGMILRPDLLFFGGPLWFGCLAMGRTTVASLAGWRGHCRDRLRHLVFRHGLGARRGRHLSG